MTHIIGRASRRYYHSSDNNDYVNKYKARMFTRVNRQLVRAIGYGCHGQGNDNNKWECPHDATLALSHVRTQQAQTAALRKKLLTRLDKNKQQRAANKKQNIKQNFKDTFVPSNRLVKLCRNHRNVGMETEHLQSLRRRFQKVKLRIIFRTV